MGLESAFWTDNYKDATMSAQLFFELLKIVVTYVIVASITGYQLRRSDRARLDQIRVDISKDRVEHLSELLAKASKLESLIRAISNSKEPQTEKGMPFGIGLPFFSPNLPANAAAEVETLIEEMTISGEAYGSVPDIVRLGDRSYSTRNLGETIWRWGAQTRAVLFFAGKFMQVWPPIEDPKELARHAVSGILELKMNIRELIEMERKLMASTDSRRWFQRKAPQVEVPLITNPWYLGRVSGREQVELARVTFRSTPKGVELGYQTEEEHAKGKEGTRDPDEGIE